jgi:predicted MFS family arabinose efflux permease
VVRRLAVPDLTTTVLTLTVTGLVADTTVRPVRIRRLISVLAMLGGALIGGVLLRWVALAAPLWLAAVLLAGCAATAYVAASRPQSDTWR